MSDDYACSEKRNKGRDKFKRRKLFPYRRGGKFRTKTEEGVIK